MIGVGPGDVSQLAARVTDLEGRVAVLEAAVAALTPDPPAAGGEALVWYPGWTQGAVPPSAPDYTAWTQVAHFGCYPTNTGSVTFTDITAARRTATISAVHGAGLSCVLTIGSEGFGAQFAASAAPSLVDGFVAAIWKACTDYGYDGVDIDWEEQVTQAPFVSLLSKLNAARPAGKQLSTAVDLGQHPAATVAAAAPFVDVVNVMTYWSDGADEVSTYVGAGVPASKVMLGIGLDSSYMDTTQALVAAKVARAQALGLRGVCAWSMDKLQSASTDPRLVPLRSFVQGS